MSDELFAQQQAIAAAGAANQARWDALDAQRQAADAGSAARMARDAAAAAERRSRQLGSEVDALRQENAALGQQLQRMASMQEAMTAIPFLRQEIALRFDRAAAVRALACRWIEGEPAAQISAALDAAGDAGEGWLSCALRLALARDLGDDAQAAGWRTRMLERDALYGRAWLVLGAMKDGAPVDTNDLLALLERLAGVGAIGYVFYELVARAGDGSFGPSCRDGAAALARLWSRQLLDSPEAQAHVDRFATDICMPVDKPRLPADLTQEGSPPAKFYSKNVIDTSRALQAIAQGIAQEPVAFTPSAPAALLLELVRVTSDEEADMRAKLAMYEAVVKDGEATERAGTVRAQTHAALVGRRYARVGVLAAFVRMSLKDPVLASFSEGLGRFVDTLATNPHLAVMPLEPGLASDAAIPDHYAERWRKQAWDDMGRERQRELQDAAARELQAQRRQARRKAFVKAALWTGGVTLVLSILGFGSLLAIPLPDIVFRAMPLVSLLAIPLFYGALAGWIAARLRGRRFDRAERAPFRWSAPVPDEVRRLSEDIVAARTRLAELLAEIPRQAAAIKETLAQGVRA